MGYKIEEIEGIGPTYGEKLKEAKVMTTDDLLELCGSKTGRKTVAEQTGLTESQLLGWANKADLMRISGIGSEFSDLLEAAGVDTVKELRTRNADNLATALKTVNDEKNLARTTPSADTVTKWIEQAKEMEPRITH